MAFTLHLIVTIFLGVKFFGPGFQCACPEDWSEFHGRCYTVEEGETLADYTYEQAKTGCASKAPGAVLAVISNRQISDYVDRLLAGGIAYWTGLRIPPDAAQSTNEEDRRGAGKFPDGTQFQYVPDVWQPWAIDEPDQGDECVKIFKGLKQWQGASSCNIRESYICQAELNAFTNQEEDSKEEIETTIPTTIATMSTGNTTESEEMDDGSGGQTITRVHKQLWMPMAITTFLVSYGLNF